MEAISGADLCSTCYAMIKQLKITGTSGHAASFVRASFSNHSDPRPAGSSAHASRLEHCGDGLKTPTESGRHELSGNCNGNFIDVQLIVGLAVAAQAATMGSGGPPASANHH